MEKIFVSTGREIFITYNQLKHLGYKWDGEPIIYKAKMYIVLGSFNKGYLCKEFELEEFDRVITKEGE